MTQLEFANYLSKKGYKMMTVCKPTERGVEATVIGKPNVTDFTQIADAGQGLWNVYISKKDFDNELITG